RETHYALLETIKRLLLPGGECWLFASKRAGSLGDFVALARSSAEFEAVEVAVDCLPTSSAFKELRAMNCSPVM
ncbi:hypothetical protein Pmar_PMAR016307, partial [Perkinsus marinus ATCC 50983]